MRRAMWVPALVAGIASWTACADSGLGPDENLSADEAVDVVADIDAMTGGILLGQMMFGGFGLGGSLGVNSGDVREFTRSRECPLGGTVTVSGEMERNRLGEGVVEFRAAASGTIAGCTRQVRNEMTLTVNGTFSMEAYRKQANGQPVGAQTTAKKGQFEWVRSDGRTGACEYEITSVRDPDAGTRTVTGTVCGRQIQREFKWGRSEG